MNKILLVLGIVGSLLFSTQRGTAETPRKIRIGTFKLVHMMAPVFHSKFLPKTYEVELVYFASSQDLEKAVMAGNIDFGQYGTTAALIAGAQNDPQLIIGDAARKGVAIVVKSDSKIKTIADLKGMRIANFPGSIQDVLLRAKLKAAGLDPKKDVTLIKVNFAEMAMALQRGDVDAFSGAEPHPTLAVTQKFGRVLSYPYDTPVGDLNSILATTRSLASKEPQLVQAVLCAHRAATEFLLKDQAEWLQVGKKLFSFEPDITKASLSNVGVAWNLSDAWVANFKAMGKTLLAEKIIAQEPDYAAMIDQSFSKKAASGACP